MLIFRDWNFGFYNFENDISVLTFDDWDFGIETEIDILRLIILHFSIDNLRLIHLKKNKKQRTEFQIYIVEPVIFLIEILKYIFI